MASMRWEYLHLTQHTKNIFTKKWSQISTQEVGKDKEGKDKEGKSKSKDKKEHKSKGEQEQGEKSKGEIEQEQGETSKGEKRKATEVAGNKPSEKKTIVDPLSHILAYTLS